MSEIDPEPTLQNIGLPAQQGPSEQVGANSRFDALSVGRLIGEVALNIVPASRRQLLAIPRDITSEELRNIEAGAMLLGEVFTPRRRAQRQLAGWLASHAIQEGDMTTLQSTIGYLRDDVGGLAARLRAKRFAHHLAR